MDDVFELYLPCDKITNDFATKPNKDKLRIIELGTIMYDNAIYTQQCWATTNLYLEKILQHV